MDINNPQVIILSSGIGLGVYIPALLIQKNFKAFQISSEVEVLEEYYMPRQQAAHIAHRDACQQNFALAQLAHRMASDVGGSLDQSRINFLLENWLAKGVSRFIVWSGFWLPIIEKYRALPGCPPLEIDHCRIDAEISASFSIYGDIDRSAREIWLWHGDSGQLVNQISVNNEGFKNYSERKKRLVLHGGGWGLGDYKDKVAALNNTDYQLDVVIHNKNEIGDGDTGNRFFRTPPEWKPWHRNGDSQFEFPPVEQLVGCEGVPLEMVDYHPFYNIVANSKAVISKPGGCTLIDSLASATPVVLLEPYGYAEKRNQQIWIELGFGVSFEAWQESGYDLSVLDELHKNIVTRNNGAKNSRTTDYVESYVELLKGSA